MKKQSVKQRPALLELLNQRGSWNLPPYEPPVRDAKYLVKVETAARAHARANPADPFAYPRIRLHLLKGFDLPSDVLESSRKK